MKLVDKSEDTKTLSKKDPISPIAVIEDTPSSNLNMLCTSIVLNVTQGVRTICRMT